MLYVIVYVETSKVVTVILTDGLYNGVIIQPLFSIIPSSGTLSNILLQ